MPKPEVPRWLTTIDPDSAERMASAYAADPEGRPRDVRPQRASVRRIRRHAEISPPAPQSIRAVTYVSAAAFRHLRETGWLGASPDVIEPEWRLAYDWMRWRMLLRIPTATGRYPVWFWLFADADWASDLTWSAKGDVILLVDLPRSQVVLSDFIEWHGVLNIWPVTAAECHVCGTRFCETHDPDERDSDDDEGPRNWEDMTADQIERYTPGWNEIFEERRQTERRMQVTCEILRAEQVLGAFEVRRSGRDYRWVRHPMVRLWRRGRRWWWKRRHPRGQP